MEFFRNNLIRKRGCGWKLRIYIRTLTKQQQTLQQKKAKNLLPPFAAKRSSKNWGNFYAEIRAKLMIEILRNLYSSTSTQKTKNLRVWIVIAVVKCEFFNHVSRNTQRP